jgi:ssDNA-binding Zn-finger/Zn-ribbon topoisomerase 1
MVTKSESQLRDEVLTLEKESDVVDYMITRLSGSGEKFSSVHLLLFFDNTANSKLKSELLHTLKESKSELTKNINIKIGLADIYHKISGFLPEKPCPDCGQPMYLKPIDEFRQVYSCSTCSRKEFYKDGELDSASSSEEDKTDIDEGAENKKRMRCPRCGNIDIGEMIFSSNKNLNSSEMEVECRKCGEAFKVPVSPRK